MRGTLNETTCGSLLKELEKIWDEIGESDSECDKMLLELEQECLHIYRRKVENSRKHKADLYKSLTEGEAEIASIIAVLGEGSSYKRMNGTLREELSSMKPVLDNLQLKKQKRVEEFAEIESQIIRICAEIAGHDQFIRNAEPQVDEQDLTEKRLSEQKTHLEELQNEKALRLRKVDNYISMIHDLSVVISVDSKMTVVEVHPSLVDHGHGQLKSISNDTLAKLKSLVISLKQETQQRLHKIQDLGSALIELWNLLDTSPLDQKRFEHVTCLISCSADEVSKPGALSLDVIKQAEIEVEKLNILKVSKMRELVLKRQTELEEIYRGVHMEVDSDTARKKLFNLIDSGKVDLSEMLCHMDDQIRQAKEEAQSRKDILDRVEKWKHASEEEIWLDGYEKDDNRYCAGRGAHKNLKRAEKARILVSKISSLVESLITKVKAWEEDKGVPFLYDKEPLLDQLEKYTLERQQREDEKRKTREQKKMQEQYATEQEAIYGSKPIAKKPLGPSMSNNSMIGTPVARKLGTPSGRLGISGTKERRDSTRVIPLNFVALAKDDQVPRCN